jgi:outer membrane protein OmpA-like peptidoglycan-associated protein
MKKNIIYLCLLFGVFSANSQSYLGLHHDNFAGVQGVLLNPASIVDSRFKTDVNLFSMSGSVANDLYGVSINDLFKSDFNFDKQAKFSPTTNNNGIVNLDLMGPSFMFNIAPKHSVAIFTRARTLVNLVQFNGNLVDQVKEGLDESSSFKFVGGSPNMVSNTWGELGISYAAILLNKEQHFLKGGFTAKYLQGGVNGYFQGNNVNVAFVENTVDPKLSTLLSQGDLTIGGSQDFETNDKIKFDTNSMGMGFDFGFVYEWRPNYSNFDLSKATPVDNNFRDLNKYKLRFGLSVTDIGSINYKNAIRDTYDLTGTVTQDDIDKANDLYEFLNKYYTKKSSEKGLKTNLPTAIHADLDWSIHNKFFLNLNGDLSLVSNNKLNRNTIADRISLTPRYESRWFSFYVPMTWMQYSGMQVGSGLRLGTFFIGSGSVLTNLVSKESKAVDFYMGFKIPVYEKKFKDTDQDGVLDKIDKCPKIAGPEENNGCPWPDTDGDTVVDKEDGCIDIAGPVENKGCPWKDTDGDGVFDNVDGCINIAGPVENKGCPWGDADKDGVLDKDDECPTVAGASVNRGCPEVVLVEIKDADRDGVLDDVDACPLLFGPADNKGCPKVTQETLMQLRVEAKSVFFTTGKATLSDAKKGETSGRLDAIKEILKNYPNAKFSINGYTDNVGNAIANLKLSKARAKVVMDALIVKGVNPANLTSKGFGHKNPVKSNKTAEGRAENRRTEIIYLGNL